MTPNILVCTTERELETHFAEDFIVNIEGSKVQTLRQFYEEIADILEIPDFGFTLDELSDSLSDLQWLDERKVVLYFTATDLLINKERDPAKLSSIVNMLDAVAEDWKWMEEEGSDEKEIVIVFEDSDRIKKVLDRESINYKMMSTLN